jgi:hypothetical protein
MIHTTSLSLSVCVYSFFFCFLASSFVSFLLSVRVIDFGWSAGKGGAGSWADRGGSAYERRETCVSCSSFPSFFPPCVCVCPACIRAGYRERRRREKKNEIEKKGCAERGRSEQSGIGATAAADGDVGRRDLLLDSPLNEERWRQ